MIHIWTGHISGVSQDGVLSPFFINNISHHISSHYHLFGDILQIYYIQNYLLQLFYKISHPNGVGPLDCNEVPV